MKRSWAKSSLEKGGRSPQFIYFSLRYVASAGTDWRSADPPQTVAAFMQVPELIPPGRGQLKSALSSRENVSPGARKIFFFRIKNFWVAINIDGKTHLPTFLSENPSAKCTKNNIFNRPSPFQGVS